TTAGTVDGARASNRALESTRGQNGLTPTRVRCAVDRAVFERSRATGRNLVRVFSADWRYSFSGGVRRIMPRLRGNDPERPQFPEHFAAPQCPDRSSRNGQTGG